MEFEFKEKIKNHIGDFNELLQELKEESDKYGILVKTDEKGNIIYYRENDGTITINEFNEKNLLIKKTIKNTENDENLLIEQYKYDEKGNKIKEWNNKKDTHTRKFDKNNNIIEEIVEKQGELLYHNKFEYDDKNRIIYEENQTIGKYHYYDKDNTLLNYSVIYNKEFDTYEIMYNNFTNGYKKLQIRANGDRIWLFNGVEIHRENPLQPLPEEEKEE